MQPRPLAILVLTALSVSACVSTHRKHRARTKHDDADPAGGDEADDDAAARPKPMPEPAPAAADAVDPTLAALPFPKMPRDEQGRDLIRVRIFPHPHGDPWQPGRKEDPGRVVVKGNCRAYRGAPDKPEATAAALATKPAFELTPAAAAAPLWLACAGPATVERGGGGGSHAYEGAFYAHTVDGALELINVVPLEAYLRGVLPSEVIPSWPAETLKAQAVASRSYAYYNVAHNRDGASPKLFDVDDTPFFQVYTGVTATAPATDLAIAATKGVALSYLGRVVLSFFCTDAGGYTESAQEVFGLNAPYCKAKKEVHAPEKSAWTKSISLASLSQKLGKAVEGVSVAPGQKTASGRVRAVTLALAGGGVEELAAVEFKKAAGVKSALFGVSVDAAKRELKLDGAGSGHGVGLSQKGAKALAKQKGWTYQQILAFYYDGATICGLDGAAAADLPRCGAALQATH